MAINCDIVIQTKISKQLLRLVLKNEMLTAFWTAGMGPVPMISGGTPAAACETILARGFRPRFWASSRDIRTTAAAPSLRPSRWKITSIITCLSLLLFAQRRIPALDIASKYMLRLPDAFPAVTVPSLSKAGLNLAKPSMVVSGLGCSSFVTRVGGPPRRAAGTLTGTISSLKWPWSNAAFALDWDSQANVSL